MTAVYLTGGSVFAGYRIERLAGKGGMGVVYEATQLALNRTVALKLISPELAGEALFRKRFRVESALAASIDHPNVVPVYEAGEQDGVLFISMRYVEGMDLGTLVAGDGRLDPGRAAGIVAQVAAALDAAHRRGLVHRDVKPANVLVTADGTEHAYLTDFGLTKRVADTSGLTKTGEFLGTVDYIAPEQINEEGADARSDVYSLGCLLFHELTGRVPFPRETQVAKIYAHLNDPPPKPGEHVPGLPAELDQVVVRAMAKDRGQRYASAGDLGRAAVAAARGRAAAEPERSVATGAAAPTHVAAGALAITRPAAPRRIRAHRGRLLAIGAVALVALTGVTLAAAGLLGGGKTRINDGKARVTDGDTRIDAGSIIDFLDAESRVALERSAPDGMKLVSELGHEGVTDLGEVAKVADFSGIDVGTVSGKPVLVFSGCDKEDRCDVWRYRFTGSPKKVSGASYPHCEEVGPSVDDGNLIFRVKRGAEGCRLGLFLKRLERSDQPRIPLLDNRRIAEGADLEVPWLAWVPDADKAPGLLVARLVEDGISRHRTQISAPSGHTFLGPLVLENGFLYFIDRPPGAPESYFITRTRIGSGTQEFERYPVSFETAPRFAVTSRDLYYSENDNMIIRDRAAKFEPGLKS